MGLLEALKKIKDIEGYVLLIDGYNLTPSSSRFTMRNRKQEDIGGVKRIFEKIDLVNSRYLLSDISIIFDSGNSKDRRYKIYKDYKGQRVSTPESKLNRKVNKDRMEMYSNYLPINFIEANNSEADDVIAYLAKDYYKDRKVLIMSTDQDYTQLLSDNISIFNPVKNKVFTLKDMSFHPHNVVLQKAIVGDASDNIKGIKGMGDKGLGKLIPELYSKKPVYLKELKEYCIDRGKYNKKYGKLLINMEDTIEMYTKIINLYDNELFIDQVEKDRVVKIIENKSRESFNLLLPLIKYNGDDVILRPSVFNMYKRMILKK